MKCRVIRMSAQNQRRRYRHARSGWTEVLRTSPFGRLRRSWTLGVQSNQRVRPHRPQLTELKKPPAFWAGGFFNSGGEGGIRTLDTFPYTHFPGVRLRPLGHLTIHAVATRGATAANSSGSTGPMQVFQGKQALSCDPFVDDGYCRTSRRLSASNAGSLLR